MKAFKLALTVFVVIIMLGIVASAALSAVDTPTTSKIVDGANGTVDAMEDGIDLIDGINCRLGLDACSSN